MCLHLIHIYAQFQEWTTRKVKKLITLFSTISTDVSIFIMISYATCAFVSACGMHFTNPNHSVIAMKIQWRVIMCNESTHSYYTSNPDTHFFLVSSSWEFASFCIDLLKSHLHPLNSEWTTIFRKLQTWQVRQSKACRIIKYM